MSIPLNLIEFNVTPEAVGLKTEEPVFGLQPEDPGPYYVPPIPRFIASFNQQVAKLTGKEITIKNPNPSPFLPAKTTISGEEHLQSVAEDFGNNILSLIKAAGVTKIEVRQRPQLISQAELASSNTLLIGMISDHLWDPYLHILPATYIEFIQTNKADVDDELEVQLDNEDDPRYSPNTHVLLFKGKKNPKKRNLKPIPKVKALEDA